MSTEHVEDLLSLYLDNALTQEEQARVTGHLQTCASCRAILTDFRRFDMLLAQQPRVSPGPALREKIFSSPEYLELIQNMSSEQGAGKGVAENDIDRRQTLPQKQIRPDGTHRPPYLVALPSKGISSSPLSKQETKVSIRTPQRRNMHIQRFMQVAIAACLLLTVGVGSFIGWNLWQDSGKTAHTDGITPPQSLHQGGPLPAGMRFVFLKDGSLWSAPEDGSTQAMRLTPTGITVAPHWTINPAHSGHTAGNLLAYIDTKQGYVHTIRSDGQSDTKISHLLAMPSSAAWNTQSGQSILESLTWSPDGQTLAFVAASAKTSAVYIYSTSTNTTQQIAPGDTGSISHLVWSPDGARIAFAFIHGGATSILDYNVQTHEVLTVTPNVATTQHPDDSVLMLDWTPMNNAPAITWSVGTEGHVHTIWLRHVGIGDNGVQLLSSGDYTQAAYNRFGAYGASGVYGTGTWVLCDSLSSSADTLSELALTGEVHRLASGSHIGVVQWAANGKSISYFDEFASGSGILHSIDTTTGANTLIASAVRSNPAPLWSADHQLLLYSAGTHSFVTDIQNGKKQLAITGTTSTFIWSTTSPHTAIIGMQDGTKGVYLVDTQHNTVKTLSTQGIVGPIVWTQVP